MRLSTQTLIILFLLALHADISVAQTGDSSKVRMTAEVGLGAGSHTSFKMAVNSVFAKNNILGLIISLGVRDGMFVPSNYNSGSLIKLGDGIPNEKVFAIGIMYGKMLYSTSPMVRISLKGGLAYCAVVEPKNFKYGHYGFFGPNYTYDRVTVPTLGLVLNPGIEFPFAKGFGMGLGILSCINKESSTIGAELSILFWDQ